MGMVCLECYHEKNGEYFTLNGDDSPGLCEKHRKAQMSNQQIDDSSIPLQETEPFPIRDHVRLQNYLKDARESNDILQKRIEELEAKVLRLTNRGIEDMRHEIATLQASNDMLKEALSNIRSQKLDDHACMGDMALRMREIADEALAKIEER
jgi:FtsZ-binding cell division protein ZapB